MGQYADDETEHQREEDRAGGCADRCRDDDVDDQRDDSSDHEYLAMREVHHADDAETIV